MASDISSMKVRDDAEPITVPWRLPLPSVFAAELCPLYAKLTLCVRPVRKCFIDRVSWMCTPMASGFMNEASRLWDFVKSFHKVQVYNINCFSFNCTVSMMLITTELLTLMEGSVTRGDRLKLCKGQTRLDVRKYSCLLRIVNPWNSLPDDVISAPTILSFEAQEAQLPLRNRAPATYFFVATLISIAHSCL